MSVSVGIRQQTFILDGPLYRVKTTVVSGTGISMALFVFKVADDTFDHYATAADLGRWPDNKPDAMTSMVGFYRQPILQRDWETVDDMNQDLQMTIERLQKVTDEWNAANTTIALD